MHDRRLFAAVRDLIVHAFQGRPTKEACRERARSLKAEGVVETITKGLEELTRVVDEIGPTVQARLKRDRAPIWRDIHWKVNHNPEDVHAELAERRKKREEARRSRIRAERAARKAVPKTKWQRIWEIVSSPEETVLVHDRRGARLRALKIESEREVVGWEKNRYGSKPIYGGYLISRHDAIRFFIDRKKRERAERRRKERAKRIDPGVERKRKEEIRAAHALKLSVAEYRRMSDGERAARERRCEWEDQRRRHDALRKALLSRARGKYHLLAIRAQIRVLKCYPRLARTAVRELADLRAAHPRWLDVCWFSVNGKNGLARQASR